MLDYFQRELVEEKASEEQKKRADEEDDDDGEKNRTTRITSALQSKHTLASRSQTKKHH